MDFGDALKALKKGARVAREGWNGRGMWILLMKPTEQAWLVDRNEAFPVQECIGMKTANDTIQPGWLASQADMLSEDWQVV